MDATIISAIIATVISAIISSIISLNIANKKNVKDEEARLNQQILELNKIAIAYPYLEDDEFCNSWAKQKKQIDEKYMRYENYCCIVFNLLEQIYKLYNGNIEKINNLIYVEELAKRHKAWWNNPVGARENIEGYMPPFREFIKKFQ